MPPPTTVVDGEYAVDVVTGLYSVTVVPDDLTHLSCVCTDVVVGSGEDVHVNFGLHYPDQQDPYGQYFDAVNWRDVMGFAGRVVDPMGTPISGATVEITAPEMAPQDYVQSETTDEGGYFSMLNVVILQEQWGVPVSQFSMEVRADGYQPWDSGVIIPTPNAMPYRIVEMQPYPSGSPVWEDSFETDNGWSFTGYYHRQQYNPSIANVSFEPANNWVVLPPDEAYGGMIPPPTDGEYFLWCGQEMYGDFIGEPDPVFCTPYSGGWSLYAHTGTATAPPVDLTAYTSARVEFDMAYDIESQIPSDYDEMRLLINGTEVRFFNPFNDPGPRFYTYSQRGYNRTMIWCHYGYDISAWAGQVVNMSFSFSTDDELYNGCRGQFIDNMKVFAN
jgi:hypothetical protein